MKAKHCGKGTPVRDSSGWEIKAGDKPKTLPKGADATVVRALKSGKLIKVKAEEKKSEPEKAAAPKSHNTDDIKKLIELSREIIGDADKDNLIGDGKPTVEALKMAFEAEGGDPDLVTAAVRDAAFNEMNGDYN